MPLIDKLTNPTKKIASREPVWAGPCGTGPNGGVTYSLLSKFLQCRERFRAAVVEGLRPHDRFLHRVEYGHMWHLCEENHAGGSDWRMALQTYCRTLCQRYPTQQEEVDKWYNVTKVQFPVYLDYWKKHPDMLRLKPIMQEQTFDVPYPLPSGRVVRLRGKWDSVDEVDGGVWLQENKTKGEVDPEQLVRQLTFDLQTMLYLVTLNTYLGGVDTRCVTESGFNHLRGIRYNVVRRPLSGGKGTIVRRKGSKNVPPETEQEYYERLAQYIKEEPETYFFRWNVTVSPLDIAGFRKRCLDPILEQLCDWWDQIRASGSNDPFWGGKNVFHWQHPYGVINAVDEGMRTEMDEYLASGSTAGLRKVDDLFPELS